MELHFANKKKREKRDRGSRIELHFANTVEPAVSLMRGVVAYESLDRKGLKYGNGRDPCANADAIFSMSIKSQF